MGHICPKTNRLWQRYRVRRTKQVLCGGEGGTVATARERQLTPEMPTYKVKGVSVDADDTPQSLWVGLTSFGQRNPICLRVLFLAV